MQDKFLKKCGGRVSSRTDTTVLFTFQPLFLNISPTLPRILSLRELSTHAKPQVQAFASYPHAKSIFKSGKSQGFPLMVRSLVFPGSTTSEFRESLLYFQESLPSLHMLEMRSGNPPGTPVIQPVHDKVLLPFKNTCCWLDTAPHELSGTCISQEHSPILQSRLFPVGMLLLARPSIVLKGQGYSSRYRCPDYVPCFFPLP